MLVSITLLVFNIVHVVHFNSFNRLSDMRGDSRFRLVFSQTSCNIVTASTR